MDFDETIEHQWTASIKHMYNNKIFKLIIGKVETSIDFKVVVKQGDEWPG